MPNLVSISFFRCKERDMFGPLTPTDHSSPPFPHLKHVMVLGEGPGLREMVKARKDYGVPLKTVVAGQSPEGSENEHPGWLRGSDRVYGRPPGGLCRGRRVCG
jgi:hypothetical protein